MKGCQAETQYLYLEACTHLQRLFESQYDRLDCQERLEIFTSLETFAHDPGDPVTHLIPQEINLLRGSEIPTYSQDLFFDNKEPDEIFEQRLQSSLDTGGIDGRSLREDKIGLLLKNGRTDRQHHGLAKMLTRNADLSIFLIIALQFRPAFQSIVDMDTL